MSWEPYLLHGLVYAFIGIFAGLMSGILGIGGGLIVVPGLVFIFGQSQIIPETITMHVAAGSSLAIMIFTSQAAIRAHYKRGVILWSVYKKLWFGVALGTLGGGILAQFIPTYWLKMLFAVFLLGVGIKMVLDRNVVHHSRFPKKWINQLISFLIGFKSGLLGVGGGILIIPYLTYCGVEVRKIAPVSNLCTFTVAIVGSMVFMITGQHEMKEISYSTGYVYWPAVLWVALFSSLIAPWGAKLNYIVPVKQLKYGFIVILFLTAFKLIY